MAAEPTDIAIPILPSRDLDETVLFYAALGFEVVFRQSEPDVYGILRRGLIELHFFGMPEIDPYQSYAGCYLRVRDVERVYAEMREADLPTADIPRLVAPEDKPWGLREFHLVDPSGNLLRVGCPIG